MEQCSWVLQDYSPCMASVPAGLFAVVLTVDKLPPFPLPVHMREQWLALFLSIISVVSFRFEFHKLVCHEVPGLEIP